LQSIIASHPDVASFTESHLFYKGILSAGRINYVLDKRLKILLGEFIRSNCSDLEEIYLDHSCLKKSAIYVVDHLLRILDKCADNRGSSIWLEKTPNNIFRIPILYRADPSIKYIHVVRRPEGVIPSLYKASRQWGRSKTWFECAVHWILSLKVTLRYIDNPNHYVIFYEDMVDTKNNIFKNVFEWIGLEWQDEYLDRYRYIAKDIIRNGEVWKNANYSIISNKNKYSLTEIPISGRIPIYLFNYYERIMNYSNSDYQK
jgi:hypothetical protein